MKGKKILATFLALVLTVIPCFSVEAAELPDDNTTEIRLNQIVLRTSDYKPDEINVVRDVAPNGTTTVTIKDKLTDEVREIITEKPLGQNTKGTYGSPDNTFLHSVVRNRIDGPVTTTIEIVLAMYSNGSFGQIDAVKSKKIFVSSSGNTTLEDKSITYLVPNNKFPAIELEYYGSGVITGSATVSDGHQFDIKFLESAGFSVNHSSQSEWYYRKYVSMGGTYSVY